MERELIGPAGIALAVMRQHLSTRITSNIALLLEGDPGVGKTAACDLIALELAGNAYAIEHINGQGLQVEIVRSWRESGVYGNLFSAWTVKRVDELDKASPAAMAEMLTLLDYLPKHFAILATTNEFERLRAMSKGRLESRFVRLHVDAPAVEETAAFLVRRHGIPKKVASAIAAGSVPEGCLATVGCNVRTAINDALAYTAAAAVEKARAA